MAEDKNLGQQSNPNWDDQNDQPKRSTQQPNPEHFEDANLGQGSGSLAEQNQRSEDTDRSDKHKQGGSAFNERHESTVGAGSSQRDEPRQNVGPLDADLSDLPSEKRSGNQTGPGLG